LMIGTAPILLAVSAAVLFRERIGLAGWLAIAASTLGVALVVLQTDAGGTTTGVHVPPSLRGDLLVIASLIAGVAWILISKHLMHRYPPIVVSTYIMLIGAAMLFVCVLVRDGVPPVSLSLGTWLALVGSGLVSTVLTTVLWNWGLTQVQVSHSAVFLNFESVVGALLGVMLLHEPLGHWVVVGGALIISAAAVITWRES
jgi:drug/metabolite transporter (DMT)-like permease